MLKKSSTQELPPPDTERATLVLSISTGISGILNSEDFNLSNRSGDITGGPNTWCRQPAALCNHRSVTVINIFVFVTTGYKAQRKYVSVYVWTHSNMSRWSIWNTRRNRRQNTRKTPRTSVLFCMQNYRGILKTPSTASAVIPKCLNTETPTHKHLHKHT